MDIIRQAGALQEQLESVTREIEALEIEGEAGGGCVRVVVDGRGVILRVRIDPDMMVAAERETLEDLIVAAHGHACRAARAQAEDKMRALMGGLPLPPGLSFPGL